MADIFSKEKRSALMSGIKGKNTALETRFFKELKKARLGRFKTHAKLAGSPDVVFPRDKIAIFIDGCFWHGCKCKTIPATNMAFWEAKIKGNKKRDRKVNRELKRYGWVVVRFWEHEIKSNSGKCVGAIKKLKRARAQNYVGL